MHDSVNHPKHYTSSRAKCSACGHGIEAIDVTEHMTFSLGNAVKYIWRADLKNNAIEDLEKAKWYITREIETRKKEQYNEIIKEQTKSMAQTSTESKCQGACSRGQCSSGKESTTPRSYNISTDAAYITPSDGGTFRSQRNNPCIQSGKETGARENPTITISGATGTLSYAGGFDTLAAIGSYPGWGTGDTMITQSGGPVAVNLTTTDLTKPTPVVYTMNHGTQWNGALASGWDITFGKGL